MVPGEINQLFEATYRYIYDHALIDLDWRDAIAAVEGRQMSLANSMGIYSDILPLITYAASGGNAERAIPLAAAWILYDLASEIFDDIQDMDGKDRSWNQWHPFRAMGVALGMVATGNVCLTQLQVSCDVSCDILAYWARTLALAARDQWNSPHMPTLEQYFRKTVTKSGLIYAAVTRAGARLHSSSHSIQKAMCDYGMYLGMVTQIWDDCLDLYPLKTRSDLVDGTYTLPVIYGLSLKEHPLHPELLATINMVEKPMGAIYGTLKQMGAISFCIRLIEAYEQMAMNALGEIRGGLYKTCLLDYVSSFLDSPDA